MLARRREGRRSTAGGTKGCATLRSTRANRTSSTTAAPPVARVPVDRHPASPALTTAYASRASPAVPAIAPGTSMPRSRPLPAPPGSSRGTGSISRTPATTLSAKVDSQPSQLVSTPPSTVPTAPPAPAIAANTPRARCRSGPSGNRLSTRANAAAAAMAAPTPCTARAVISSAASPAKAPSSEAADSTPRPARKTRRRPSRSAARPLSRSSPPKDTR
ncbi:hypothetical protein STENM327S_02459 [Streptomyces tendae]